MKNRTLLTVLAALAAVAASAETMIDLDFSRPGAISSHPVAGARIQGELPAGWSDNSSFGNTWLEYSFGDEQGTRFQRTTLVRMDDNWGQFCIDPLPDAPDRRRYRLALTCRNRTGGNITFGLRRSGHPYSFYWSRQERFAADWQTFHWEFDLPKNDARMGFWVCLYERGSFDIRALKLERFSRDDIIAEIKRTVPDKGPANLLRVSRFPLGLPSGWSITREVSDGDDAVTGAAEEIYAPATKIFASRHLIVYSAPVPLAYPVTGHTASIDVRGSGNWSLSAHGDGVKSPVVKFKAEESWQRIEARFEPSYNSISVQLLLQGEGTLYIDKLQIGPSEKYAGTYQPPAAAEVAVALAPGPDAATARVVFDDEPAAIDIAATGAIDDATLRIRVYDIHDKLVMDETRRAAPRTRITALPAIYGSLRMEAALERAGRPISPTDELVWHRLRRPRHWGRDAPDSPFGVHTLSVTRHILMAKAIGINWTRLHDAGLEYCGWWNLEPEHGQWRFFDEELRRYRRHGIKIFAELGTAPPWASYYPESGLKSFGYFDKFFQPKSLEDYANYVRVFCSRYRSDIDAFDVWNEPWIKAWWGVGYDHSKTGRSGYITSENPQADFARLTRTAHTEVHRIIPGAKVFGFNTTTSPETSGADATSMGGASWTRGVLQAGGMQHCDGIAYHCYTTGGVGYPGDSVERGLQTAIGPILEQHGGKAPKPVWMTEGSPLIHRMGNGLYRQVCAGEAPAHMLESADRIARYQLAMLANGVARVFIYSMHTHTGIFSPSPKEWNAFTTDDGFLHPCGAAHAHLAWQLEDTRFVERMSIGRGVHAYLFQGENRAVAAVSAEPDFEERALPRAGDILATDLFGNPLPANAVFHGRVVYIEAPALEILRKALL